MPGFPLLCLSPLYLTCLWGITLSVLILLSSQDKSMKWWLAAELSVITTLLLLALFAFRRKSGYSRVALAFVGVDILMTGVFFALSVAGIRLVVAADTEPKPIHLAAFPLILLYTLYQLYRLLAYTCGLWPLCCLQSSVQPISSESPDKPDICSDQSSTNRVIMQSPELCSSQREYELEAGNCFSPNSRNSDAISLVCPESSLA